VEGAEPRGAEPTSTSCITRAMVESGKLKGRLGNNREGKQLVGKVCARSDGVERVRLKAR